MLETTYTRGRIVEVGTRIGAGTAEQQHCLAVQPRHLQLQDFLFLRGEGNHSHIAVAGWGMHALGIQLSSIHGCLAEGGSQRGNLLRKQLGKTRSNHVKKSTGWWSQDVSSIYVFVNHTWQILGMIGWDYSNCLVWKPPTKLFAFKKSAEEIEAGSECLMLSLWTAAGQKMLWYLGDPGSML